MSFHVHFCGVEISQSTLRGKDEVVENSFLEQELSIEELNLITKSFPLLVEIKNNTDIGKDNSLIYTSGEFENIKLFPQKRPGSIEELLTLIDHSISICSLLKDLHKKKLSPGILCKKRFWTNKRGEMILLGNSLIKNLPGIRNISQLELEDFHFVAPEYSDNLKTAPDHRADLYGLGVLLYNWITGKYPIDGNDQVEMMHRHLTQVIINPSHYNDIIPESLDKIVLTLLAKTPEERYQSASGILKDFEWFKNSINEIQAEEFGTSQKFNPGEFQLEDQLFGRQNELNILNTNYNDVNKGYTRLVFVGGYSGVGKTSLIRHFSEKINQENSLLLTGKFDQYTQTPYSPIKQAFKNLEKEILLKSSIDPDFFKETILDSLGDNAGVLLDIIPDLEVLTGKLSVPEKLNPIETQNRFIFVFTKFCKSLTELGFTLTIFIDDWQWCDIPSLQLLKSLTASGMKNTLFVFAYRNNEISESHPFYIFKKEIEAGKVYSQEIPLGPLDLYQTNEIVSATLDLPLKNTTSLSNLIMKKTEGNPFYSKQFLSLLKEKGLLLFDENIDSWIWDENKIIEEELAENVVDIISKKLNVLPIQLQVVCKIAAFASGRFDPELLSSISGYDIIAIEHLLKKLLDSDLLSGYINEDNALQYSFNHDRIQQASYQLNIPALSTTEEELHYDIGISLLHKNFESKYSINEVAIHFLHSKDLITDDLATDIIQLMIRTGQRANISNSPQASRNYFDTADMLANKFNKKDKLFDILRGFLEACFLLNDIETAELKAEEAIEVSDNILQQAEILVTMMMFYEGLAMFEKNIDTGLRALSLFDINIKQAYLNGELEKEINSQYGEFISLTTSKGHDELMKMEPMTDLRQMALMDILVNMNASAYFVNLYLFAWNTLRMTNQTLKYGLVNSTPFAFVFMGSLQVALFKKFKEGYEFGHTGVQLLNKVNSNKYRCRTLSIFPIFIQHFKEPILAGADNLKESIYSGLETGDLPYAGYSFYARVRDAMLAGDNLEETLKLCNESIDFMKSVNNIGLLSLMKLLKGTLLILRGDYTEEFRREEDEALKLLLDVKFFTAVAHHYIFRSWVFCIFKSFDKASELLKKNEEIIIYAASQPHVPKHYFLQSLCLLQKETNLNDEQLQKIQNNQAFLKDWAESMPENFKAEYCLIDSLLNGRTGNWNNAFGSFNETLNWGEKGKLIGVKAFAYELFADMLQTCKMEHMGTELNKTALKIYTDWGAVGKIQTSKSSFNSYQKRTTGSFSDFDINTIIKATQAISAEVNKDKLIKRLLNAVMENAGADKSILVLLENGVPIVEAVESTGKETEIIKRIELKKFDSVPRRLIEFVINTKKEFILDETVQIEKTDSIYFENSPVKSLLILPILNQRDLVGLLYLENSQVSGLFTGDHLEVLRIIASQAAISITNTSLFEKLSHLNEKLESSKEELSKMNLILEEKIKDRTQVLRQEIEMRKLAEGEFKKAKEEADDANKAKSLFLANMSHEIRSPLNAIVGFSQILMNQSQRLDLSSEFKQYLNNIKVSGENLSEVISDILDLSKIEAGKMTLSEEDVDLKQTVKSIYHINKDTAKAKGVELLYEFGSETPKYILSDRSKLKQILMNLLSNAIKFTPKNKKVWLFTEFKDDNIIFKVIDEGIGISKEKLDLIFDPFVQVESGFTRQYQGTGLGLTITRNLVKLLGGDISVTSEEGKTEFIVVIPYKKSLSGNIASSGIELRPLNIPRDVKILVVEDNPMNQEMIKALFAELGKEIIVAANGEEGIETAKNHKPDIIYMDIHMPKMDGFEAVKRIRNFDKNVPIIALSADAFKEQQENALKSGFSGYLTKPIQLPQFLASLENFIVVKDKPKPFRKRDILPAEKDLVSKLLHNLSLIPIYETEKLTEIVSKLSGFVSDESNHSLLDAIYTGDEKNLNIQIDNLKKEYT